MAKLHKLYYYSYPKIWETLSIQFAHPNEYSTLIEIQCTCTQQDAWPDLSLFCSFLPLFQHEHICFLSTETFFELDSFGFVWHSSFDVFFFWSNLNANDRNLQIRQKAFSCRDVRLRLKIQMHHVLLHSFIHGKRKKEKEVNVCIVLFEATHNQYHIIC